MEWFNVWWGGLGLSEQILYCIALPSTLILIIQAIMILFGAGGDVDGGMGEGGLDGADGGDGGDFDSGDGAGEFGAASMFTLQGVASFLCVFGWGSILMQRGGLPLLFAMLVALVLGIAVMYAMAKVVFYLTKLAHTGTLDVKNLLGSMGTVYLRIPPKGEGRGKVMVQTSERLVEFDAISEGEEPIPNNAQVRVIDILGENVLVVEQH